MRYEKGHKDATRKHIVEVASRRLRRDGIEATGIAPLMADAGLTHGGFYSHFASKEALLREVITDTLSARRAKLAGAAANAADPIEGLVRYYLRPLHRDEPEQGCAIAALAPEIGRQSMPTREAFADELDTLIDLIADHLLISDPEDRRRAAEGIFAVMMGALQLARAVNDPARSEQLMQSGIEAALRLAR
jgi:TetR/AcrR family transcriptional repressor of nem operon